MSRNADSAKQPFIPVVDIPAEIASLRPEILDALGAVLDEAAFISGPAVERFEAEFSAFCGGGQCVALNSGTSALHIAMQCLDVGPGDEVIVPAMTFIATAWPIYYLGARPVFVDIDPARYTLDPAQVEAALTPKTKAIVPVHLYGQCADMDPLLEMARARGIAIIEDCAQSHGAVYKGRTAGRMGAVSCFSFYPSKNIGACGEAGGILTDDAKIAARARRLRDHAQSERYLHHEIGYNYRMDGFQGAILSTKLPHLRSWIERRQAAAARYDSLLAGADVVTPAPCPDGSHVYYLYVIQARERDALRDELAKRNIGTALHYPVPLHLQPAFADCGHRPGDFPVSERLATSCVSIPLFPTITEEQIGRVVEAIGALRGRAPARPAGA